MATDGSNDKNEQLYPIVIRVYSPSEGKISTQLIAICEPKTSQAKDITAVITDKFKSLNVPLSGCVSFASDNANVMTGAEGGVIAGLRKLNKDILLAPCVCHLLNLMTKKASSKLPISVDVILVDIYYYFHHSSKRRKVFEEFQLLFDDDVKQILKHCATRWLSLTVCLQRIVDLWLPLRHYMSSELRELEAKLDKKKKKKEKDIPEEQDLIDSMFSKHDEEEESPTYAHQRLLRINAFLSSRSAAAYCSFLLWFIPTIEKLNKTLQKDQPLIHILQRLILNFLRDILSRFVQPSFLADVKDLQSVKYKDTKIQVFTLII